LARYVPVDSEKVLEIGCATGGFRQNFGECEYWGVECLAEVANQASEVLDHVLVGTFEQNFDKIPDHYFDTVVCNDVIEHMIDHDAFFNKIKQKMVAHGKIYGSIPNVRYVDNLKGLLFQKEWVYRDEGILDRTHLHFFTCKSLKRTLEHHGYEIYTLEGVNSVLPKKWYHIDLQMLIRRLLIVLFGSDIQYLQFYFIASPKAS